MASILIIEDDKTIRRELSILLEKYGYEVFAADDFNNVVEYALSTNCDLILLDLNLPFYDGFHICKEIRKFSKTPIIVVTSQDSDLDELMSINSGADDFVTKPYNTQILLARITAVLKRTYDNDSSNLITFKDLTLDLGKSIVSFKEKSIDLTKNELRILEILMKNKDNITSREEIINELWQSNRFIDDNTLTVNVNRLRKKLQDLGMNDYLKTKRGQGYLL